LFIEHGLLSDSGGPNGDASASRQHRYQGDAGRGQVSLEMFAVSGSGGAA
jgi:hypothetical protein